MASIKTQLQQLEDQITNISYVLFSIQGIIFASLFGQFMEAKCTSFFLQFLLSFFAGAFSLNAIVWKILSLKKILDEIAQPSPPQSQSPPPPPETMRITQSHLQPSPQEAATASSPQQISIDIMRPPSPSPSSPSSSSSSSSPPPPPPPETAAPALTAAEVTQAYWFHVRIPLFLSTGFFFLSLFACWYVPCRYSAPAAAAPPMVAHPRLYANRR